MMKRKRKIKLGVPWEFKLEPVYGCNRKCWFCGLWKNGYDHREFIKLELVEKFAFQISQFAPESRIGLSQRGEPTLHPQIFEVLEIIRTYLPKAQISMITNGLGFKHGKMNEYAGQLFKSGLDIIILDTYSDKDLLSQLDGIKSAKIKLVDVYNNPDNLSCWHNYHRKLKRVIFHMGDLGKQSGDIRTRKLHNYAGNCNPDKIPYPKKPLKNMCVRPFREMTVTHTGDVVICCSDFGSNFIIDNINNKHLKHVWYSEEMDSIRAALFNKNRTFSPCNQCTYHGGFRKSFLPKMPQPTKKQMEYLYGTGIPNMDTKQGSCK